MANTFQARGTLSISDETDKFQPFKEFISKSGWVNPRLIFNLTENGYRHSFQVGGTSNALYKEDESNDIYVLTKATYNSSGQKVSDGESEKIAFADRKNPKVLARVANWTKYILDLNTPTERSILRKMNQKLAEGEPLTADDLQELNVATVEDAKNAVEALNRKRLEFITIKDFIEGLMTVIKSGKYSDRHFFISKGRFNHSYNADKQTTYENLEPLQIYLDEETEDKKDFATASVDFYFSKDAVDKTMIDDGKLYIKGWIIGHDSKLDQDIFVEKVLTFNCDNSTELGKAQIKYIENKYKNTSNDDLWMMPTDVALIDGSERIEITEQNLSDDQKQLIALGFKTFEEIKKELHGYIRGESVHEWRWLPKIDAKVTNNTGFKIADTVIKLENNLFDDTAKTEDKPVEDTSEDEFEKLFNLN